MMFRIWCGLLLIGLLDSSQGLDSAAILRLDSCTLEKSVKDSLLAIDFSHAMVQPPAQEKKPGKKKGGPAKGMSQMKLLSLEFTKISANLLPGIGINMSSIIKIALTGKSFIGGNMDVKMEVKIDTITQLIQGEKNCPKFIRKDCQTVLLNVKANVPSGILPNVLNNFLDKTLHKLLPTTLCPTVETVLKGVNGKLCSVSAKMPLGKYGFIEYSVSHLPEVTGEFIELHVNAMIEQMEGTVHSLDNSSVPISITSNEDATMFALSADLLSSAYTALQAEGIFNINITQETLSTVGTLPPTSSLSTGMPTLPPLSQSFLLKIDMKDDAVITLSFDKAMLHLHGRIELWDSIDNSDLQSIFTLNAHINLRCSFSLADGKLKNTITLDKIFLSLVSSVVDSLDVSSVEEFVKLMLNEIFVPAINVELEVGIPLPDMLNINFSNGEMEILQNLILFSLNTCEA